MAKPEKMLFLPRFPLALPTTSPAAPIGVSCVVPGHAGGGRRGFFPHGDSSPTPKPRRREERPDSAPHRRETRRPAAARLAGLTPA